MQKFNKYSIEKLKAFLYNSRVHDAKIESIEYSSKEKSVKVKTFNPIFSIRTNLTFYTIKAVLSIKGKSEGDPETIVSLTAEDDFSYLQLYLPGYDEGEEPSLYLLFQMFSGNELHIVSGEVAVEVIT